jgi:hypothetical protein
MNNHLSGKPKLSMAGPLSASVLDQVSVEHADILMALLKNNLSLMTTSGKLALLMPSPLRLQASEQRS